jgi:hypothetical protein
MECWRYNLTSNVINCYVENPFQIIIDNWIGILFLIIVFSLVTWWYFHDNN